eukprot:8321378-Alexandrium_andersonii.AAC.1
MKLAEVLAPPATGGLLSDGGVAILQEHESGRGDSVLGELASDGVQFVQVGLINGILSLHKGLRFHGGSIGLESGLELGSWQTALQLGKGSILTQFSGAASEKGGVEPPIRSTICFVQDGLPGGRDSASDQPTDTAVESQRGLPATGLVLGNFPRGGLDP